MQFSLAQSSKLTQNSYLQSFVKFCQLFGFNSLPADPQTLVFFVVYKTVVMNHAVSTTTNILSAVRRAHLAVGYNLPTPSEFFPLKEALRGACRYLSRPTIQKFPIYPSLLMCLVGGTGWGSPLRCLYLTLWFTFARLASLIPTLPNANFEAHAHLSWGNIQFFNNSVLIILEKTKTIQCKEKNLQFHIPRHSNSSVCLLTQLRSWYSSTPFKAPNDPVFLTMNGSVWQPLTRSLATPL